VKDECPCYPSVIKVFLLLLLNPAVPTHTACLNKVNLMEVLPGVILTLQGRKLDLGHGGALKPDTQTQPTLRQKVYKPKMFPRRR